MTDDQPGAASRWGVGYNLSLAHGVGPDRHLRACCDACGRVVVFDPAPWTSQRLGGLRLTYFEDRLRCICGARTARLEVWTGPAPAAGSSAAIFLHR